MQGALQSLSSTSTNRAAALRGFPGIGWRETQQEFVKDAVGWAFARDFSQGLRIRRIREYEHVAEMWALPAKGSPIWTANLPRCGLPKPVKLLLDPIDKVILLREVGKEGIATGSGDWAYAIPFPLGADRVRF